MAITMGTAVFKRIVMERVRAVRDAAIVAIADTMEETTRFGCGSREYVEDCATRRLKAEVEGQPWTVNKMTVIE